MEFFLSIVSGLISGTITGVATCWVFYDWSGKDLKREASELRRINLILLRAIHNAGIAEVHFDQAGNPTGLIINLSAKAEEKATVNADLSVG